MLETWRAVMMLLVPIIHTYNAGCFCQICSISLFKLFMLYWPATDSLTQIDKPFNESQKTKTTITFPTVCTTLAFFEMRKTGDFYPYILPVCFQDCNGVTDNSNTAF